ncbi:MAG: gamma-glutamyltransferase [Anaerolineae bacterium]|jgi:gamma-glutamyltranspeptidase/glutathione hydrolase|nr:gamma-glutamyltransferase [Anaerolineae bacterium]
MSSSMVVCAEPPAAEAGAAMLRRGGNAMDAAVAASFAQGVTNPMLCGIGGKGVMTVYRAATGEMAGLRFWGEAGSKAHAALFAGDYVGQEGAVTGYIVQGDRNCLGYESIMVPGFVRGIHDGWQRFGSGRIPWGDLLEPAIRLARDGFEVYPYLYRFWGPNGIGDRIDGLTRLTVTAASAAVYTHHGRTYAPGECLVQADLGRTLERIARDGPEAFYSGEVARAIAADVEANGGLFTLRDLAEYRTLSGEPIIGTYRGYQVLSDRPPGCGVLLVELLNVAEGWDLRAMGWNSPKYLDKISRAMQSVFADRARHMADPRFVHVPVERLVSKDYAAELRRKIDTGQDLLEPTGQYVGGGGTTHLSVLDREGNAVSITHTLGMSSGVVTPGLGFLYNNDMDAFDPLPRGNNSIAPGKMPVNGGAPSILLKDGQVAMVIGSPAGALKLTAELQAVVNVVDFGMGMQQAVSAARIHSEDEKRVIVVEPSFPAELAAALERMGNTVRRDRYTARLSAIWRDPATGELEGGADPRGGGGLAEVRD